MFIHVGITQTRTLDPPYNIPKNVIFSANIDSWILKFCEHME